MNLQKDEEKKQKQKQKRKTKQNKKQKNEQTNKNNNKKYQKNKKTNPKECWRMTDKDINRLSSFHNTCLRKIMKIFWPNKISNKDLHNITNTKDMETLLLQKRWRWLGYVLRKSSEDMTSFLHSSLLLAFEGKRKRGRPKKTWRRTIENEINERGYTWDTIKRKANNREEWMKLVLALCTTKHSKD